MKSFRAKHVCSAASKLKTFSLHMNTLTQPSDFRAHASKQSGLAHYSIVITPPSNRRQIASCCIMELLEMQFPAH
jgi:hypothetical protein